MAIPRYARLWILAVLISLKGIHTEGRVVSNDAGKPIFFERVRKGESDKHMPRSASVDDSGGGLPTVARGGLCA